MAYEILVNASQTLATNATVWVTREEVEHFLGDPDVLHSVALVLGTISILFGRRLPQVLAFVASVSFGLWVGLLMQDRQIFNQPMLGVDLPEGIWLPLTAGAVAAVSAALLVWVAWRTALILLTAGLFMFVSVAICRLANVSPERMFDAGASLLSTYRVVGAVSLIVALLVFALIVRRFHDGMVAFASAGLGTLLFLSGVSHFAQRAGTNEAPFSLLDDLARVFAEVRSGQCHLWDKGEDEDIGLKGCDCSHRCQTEILAWLTSSGTVLAGRAWMEYSARRAKKKQEEDEETGGRRRWSARDWYSSIAKKP